MKNYFQVQSDIFKYDLSPYDLAVYANLAMRRNRKTNTAWPAVATIADECNMGDSTVRKSIQTLKAKGLITVRANYQPTHRGFNRQTANIYTIPALDAVSVAAPTRKDNGVSLTDGEEINTTKNNITKFIEPSSSELRYEDDEFEWYRDYCYFDPSRDEAYPTSDIKEFAKRTLDALWMKKSITVDGIKYSKQDIRYLMIEKMMPDHLDSAIKTLMTSGEVTHPTSYLMTCVISEILNSGAYADIEYAKYRGAV